MPLIDRLRTLLEEIDARDGPLGVGRTASGHLAIRITTVEGTRTVPLYRADLPGLDENVVEGAALVLRRDLLARGVNVTYSVTPMPSGYQSHRVTSADGIDSTAADPLMAHAAAWVSAAKKREWGAGTTVQELLLRRQVTQLQRDVAELQGALRSVHQLAAAARKGLPPGFRYVDQLLAKAERVGWVKRRD